MPFVPKRFYEFGTFRLDPSARVLLRAGEVAPLAPKVVDTLVVLVEKAGRLVEKDALMRAVWPDTFVEENNLTHNISVLRKTLGNDPGGRLYIETIPKRGYRFVGEVTEIVQDGQHVEAAQAPQEPFPAPGRPQWVHRTAPAVAALVILTAAVLWARQRFLSTPRLRTLAVLPFQDLSGGQQQDYLSDGVTEALIGELAKLRNFRVISRTSVMQYRGTKKPLPEIARDLNVELVLEGSVARFGDRVRLSVQLLDAAKDDHLWAESYERAVAEVPRWQGQVAASVAHEIRITTTPEEKARLAGRPVNRAAFEEYIRGRYYWNRRTVENIHKAIEHFRTAIHHDPAYARAYAGLADCYNQLGTVFMGSKPPTETRPLAIANAKKALEIEPDLAEAHASLAYARLYDWDWAAAEAGFRRAIQLNPSYGSAHLWYSHFLSTQRRHDEAFAEVRLAQELDPLSPIIQTQAGWALQHAGRYDEAIDQLQKVLAADPNYLWALWRLGSSSASARRFEEGIQALEKAAAVSNRSPAVLGTLAETYGLAGRKEEAQKVLDELKEMSQRRYVPAIAFVHAYIGLGDTDRIFEWLETAWRYREQGIAYLAVWEDYGPYRTDRRYLDLMRRVGLER
jgi:TolB-like protein/DNA-binding winged helix-turn-helix (wHTH) protein/Tfp pilus assembly protein PilF